MTLRALAMMILLSMVSGSPLRADDARCGFRLWSRPWLRVSDCPHLGGSCDDYCRKPCPTVIPVSRCGCPDDYCRKTAPCITPVLGCGCPDDYRKKSMPCHLCPPRSPYLLFGSVGQGCPLPTCR